MEGVIIMFKFREIKETKEHDEINDKKEEGYKKIKPKKNMSVEEAMHFVDMLFMQVEDS